MTQALAQHILILDDDTAVRNSLKFSLEAEGFVVHAYADPAELLNEDSYRLPGA